MRVWVRCVVPVVLLIGIGGCTSMGETFERYSADQVWKAMVAVANSPGYDDWKISANDVWVDEPNRRIEIYRELRRVLYRADAPPHREDRTWRFEVILEQSNPPQARFTSRGFSVITEARAESRRYFAEVYDVLIGLPEVEEPLESSEPELPKSEVRFADPQ